MGTGKPGGLLPKNYRARGGRYRKATESGPGGPGAGGGATEKLPSGRWPKTGLRAAVVRVRGTTATTTTRSRKGGGDGDGRQHGPHGDNQLPIGYLSGPVRRG